MDQWLYVGKGDFDITLVNRELCDKIPTELDMGKVYSRLIVDTALPNEDYVSGIIRVYNNEICETIDNYNGSAYYEHHMLLLEHNNEGGFLNLERNDFNGIRSARRKLWKN